MARPRWAEAGRELLTWLLESAPVAGEMICTQLSNVMTATEHDRIARPEGAQQLMQSMLQDFPKALSDLRCPGCVVWAPMDGNTVGRWIAGYVQHAASAGTPKTVRMLVPLESCRGAVRPTISRTCGPIPCYRTDTRQSFVDSSSRSTQSRWCRLRMGRVPGARQSRL